MPRLRRVPVDVVAFLAIAVVLVVVERPFLGHGMCFNDSAWYYHFGHRALAGDVPYRDYVFQVGPLPIYVDAAFQWLFGASYLASMYAALFLRILRVLVIWMLARRLVDLRAAVLLATFCAFDQAVGWAHHWSWCYAELLLSLSGLCVVLAVRAASERRTLWLLGLAGLSAALVVSARQATAVMVGLVMVPATLVLWRRGEYFTRARVLALAGGFALGLVVVAAALAAAGALGPAIQQMFLEAPQKKGVHGLSSVLDPISGGALVDPDYSWWGGLLILLGLPIAFVAIALGVAARGRPIATGALAVLVVPAAIVVGLLARDASLDGFALHADLPRMALTATTALAVLSPDRLRRWLGLEPVVAIALGGLPLASEWALQLSLPGPGWCDIPALLVGVVLVILASSLIAPRVKTLICLALAVVGVGYAAVLWAADHSPFALPAASDGTLGDTRFVVDNPVLRGVGVSESRKQVVDWLAAEVKPGSSCFMYGTLAVLYDILACKNPTRIDVTIPDFITAGDAEQAIAVLRAAPPDYLISCEHCFMNPSLAAEMGKNEPWSPLNPEAARVMYLGLRSLLDRYDSVGLAADLLGPALSKQASEHWDSLQSVRLYRRKR